MLSLYIELPKLKRNFKKFNEKAFVESRCQKSRLMCCYPNRNYDTLQKLSAYNKQPN